MEFQSHIDVIAYQETAEGEPEISRFTLQISPMPSELVHELHMALVEATNKFFTDKGVSSGRMTGAPTPAAGGLLQ